MTAALPNRILDPWNLSAIQPSPLCEYARENRGQIAKWVCDAFEQCFPNDADKGACLYWTWAGCQILRRCGYRAILQAGSASWPIQPDRGDDNPTHFSYIWDPEEPQSAAAIALGKMPEVHVWIGLPDEGELLDFSTGNLKEVCEQRHGLSWELPDPPPFIWVKPHQLPDRWIYRPHMAAIRYILMMLAKDL